MLKLMSFVWSQGVCNWSSQTRLLSAQMPLLGLNVNQGPYNDIRELNILHFYDNSFWLLYLLFRAPTCERNWDMQTVLCRFWDDMDTAKDKQFGLRLLRIRTQWTWDPKDCTGTNAGGDISKSNRRPELRRSITQELRTMAVIQSLVPFGCALNWDTSSTSEFWSLIPKSSSERCINTISRSSQYNARVP